MDPKEKEITTRIQSPEEIRKKPVKLFLKDLAKNIGIPSPDDFLPDRGDLFSDEFPLRMERDPSIGRRKRENPFSRWIPHIIITKLHPLSLSEGIPPRLLVCSRSPGHYSAIMAS
ncbi:MAG: hypothetical protein QCI82_10800 [Candidatus Thermoplasmatota archaeon]|nr:hypothetical protein [Candidatus Thermoplasmatota archaeon]